MKLFFLATCISYVIYYLSRVGLTLAMFIRREHLENVKEIRGFFPNLFVVGIIIGYGTAIINLTIFLALVIKHYLL